MTAKFFKRRDSATAWLRKQGVPNTEYDKYITTGTLEGEEGFCCTFPNPVPTAKPVETPPVPVTPIDDTKKAVVIEERKKPRTPASNETATEAIRRLIRAGNTNEEIWKIVKKQFNLDDKKKYYPSWYRFDLRRKGEKV